jgi:cell wall-associated NlpC family hydrolase
MRQRNRAAAAAITTCAILASISGLMSINLVSSATADPLASAQTQAAALTKTVNALRTEEEVAAESYDGAEAQLSVAVAERGQADQALDAVQASAEQAQQTVADHARALYESGGDSTVLASLLTSGNPTQALDSYRLAGDVIAYETQTAHRAAATLAQASSLADRDAAISRRVTKLQATRQAAADKVQSLLVTQEKALAAVNSTVRKIMRADEAAQAAASAADFVSAVQADGGNVNLSGSQTPPNAIAAAAIAAARSRLGVPYVWGATGPDSFDCSGLTQWSYAHAGINLPRTAAEQWNAGPHPSLADLEPGDLLFYATNTSDPGTIHHVTMYIGGGQMIAAPETGENVQIQAVYMAGFIGAMRPWAKTTSPS